MKTLSIKQPWASLIAIGLKDIENRTWRINFRGRIYIHAAKARIKPDDLGILLTDQNYFDIHKYKKSIGFEDRVAEYLATFPLGAIIGEVDIVDCVNDSKSPWAMENHWHWVLKNPVLYKEPILNVKGKLSFWEFNKEEQ